MSDVFATEDDYAKLVQLVGPKRAKRYIQSGMEVRPNEVEFKPIFAGVGGNDVQDEETDNTEMDGETTLGALPGNLPNGIPAANLASIRSKLSEYSDLADQQKAFYDNLEQELLTRRIGPSKREQLLQISAALLQPTETRGFGASLANLLPVLQQQEQQRREGMTSRADALQKLRMQQLADRKALLGQELNTEVALARIANQNAGAGRTYDEKRGIYVNKNNPRPTETEYKIPNTNRILVQWQDGLWRETLSDGTYKVFERAGNNFNELGVERAR